MGGLLQAHGSDAELRAQFEAEVAERQQRADAEAKRMIEVEKQRVVFARRLEIQDMQAKVAHYEAMANRTKKDLEEQRTMSAEEMRRIFQFASAERDQ